MRLLVIIVASLSLVAPARTRQNHRDRPIVMHAIATAHSQHGESASGEESHRGTVAADPRVLPLGSVIRIEGAGPYSGVYQVIDTGPAIKGRRIDIYMPTAREARQFGKKRVLVTVLERGNNQKLSSRR